MQEKSDIARNLAERLRSRATSNPSLLRRATPIQRKYIADTSPLVTYLAGRRHGKTDAVAVRIAEHARPHTMQAYVAPTITRANEILLPVLRQLKRECGLRWELKGDTITFATGGQLRLMGMSNTAEIEKLRGEDLLAAYFDECGVPKDAILREAVLSCAWEALRKHRGEPGSGVSLSGTPGPLPEGFFWEATTQAKPDGTPMYGATRHFGLIYDNPLFAQRMSDGRTKAEHSIDQDIANGIYVSREDSRFRREVLAQWCLPTELRCYSHAPKILLPQAQAPEVGRTVLSADFGWNDATALVVTRMTPFREEAAQPDGGVRVVTGERMHVLYAEKRSKWQLSDIAQRVRELRELFRCGTVIGDSGGNRLVIEAFASQYGIPMLPCQKSGFGFKRSRIHTVDDLFAVGHVYLYEGAAPLHTELRSLVWDEDRQDHDPRQEDHCADAFGYAAIESYLPVTESRIASREEKEREAAASRKRHALSRVR